MHRIMTRGLAAIALAMAIGVPVDAQASEPSVSPPSSTLPATFTATIMTGGQVRSGTTQVTDGVVSIRGNAWVQTIVAASDPRIRGRVTISHDSDEYTAADGTTVSAGAATWRITNDEGAWQGSYPTVDVGQEVSIDTVVLTGEGAYEGLTIVWEQTRDWSTDRREIRGIIIPAPPPDTPNAP